MTEKLAELIPFKMNLAERKKSVQNNSNEIKK